MQRIRVKLDSPFTERMLRQERPKTAGNIPRPVFPCHSLVFECFIKFFVNGEEQIVNVVVQQRNAGLGR